VLGERGWRHIGLAPPPGAQLDLIRDAIPQDPEGGDGDG
jgi:hypothetical protein